MQRVNPRCLPFLPFAASQSSVNLAELGRKLEVRRAPVTLGARATKGPVGPRLPVRHVCFPDPSITRRWAGARPDHSITGRGHQFDFIRSLPLRNRACPPAALRRPFPSPTGCFRRKPLPRASDNTHSARQRGCTGRGESGGWAECTATPVFCDPPRSKILSLGRRLDAAYSVRDGARTSALQARASLTGRCIRQVDRAAEESMDRS